MSDMSSEMLYTVHASERGRGQIHDPAPYVVALANAKVLCTRWAHVEVRDADNLTQDQWRNGKWIPRRMWIDAQTADTVTITAEDIRADLESPSGLADGGERTTYATGATREPTPVEDGFDELIPPVLTRRLAAHYGRGAIKYPQKDAKGAVMYGDGGWNWHQGLPTHRTIRGMAHHLRKYMAGDRSEDHLAAIAWAAGTLMDHEERIASGELPREIDTFPILADSPGFRKCAGKP